jgi:hypothetical protein
MRTRKAIAVTCMVLVVFAAFVPLGGMSLEWLVVTPVFILLPPGPTAVARPHVPRRDERLVALLAIVDTRGPPSVSSLL